MIRNLRWTEDAERDLDEAVGWYEEREAGLGARLVRELRPLLERIQVSPELYPVVHHSARQVTMRKFPYSIIYQVSETEVLVVAVVHTARDDDRWHDRVDRR
jgi:plasmid stabilization system protein ParE